MLTLNELRKEIGELPEKDEKAPSYKRLVESGEKVIAKYGEKGSEVTVYANGYVVYQDEERATVFPFPKKKSFQYKSSCGMRTAYIKGSDFDDMGWYFRLILEGEDRLRHNADNRFYYRVILYGDYSEEWKELKDPVGSAEDIYFAERNKKIALDAMDVLTKKQRYVITEHFLNGVSYKEIAEDLGITRQAVRDTAEKALRRMRKYLEKKKEKIF
ncbi:MAG: sigma-70 family RNA polymerase sigma factor [Oscillospiraceae bacterium]|nr:sigma-70 family RNA polymerase sigma factor [Oscillospiraceae bacterium]